MFENEPFAFRGRKGGGIREQRFRVIPGRLIHRSPLIRRPSQNRAAAILRGMVAGESILAVASQERLADQRARLQRVIEPLPADVTGGNAPQLTMHRREQQRFWPSAVSPRQPASRAVTSSPGFVSMSVCDWARKPTAFSRPFPCPSAVLPLPDA